MQSVLLVAVLAALMLGATRCSDAVSKEPVRFRENHICNRAFFHIAPIRQCLSPSTTFEDQAAHDFMEKARRRRALPARREVRVFNISCNQHTLLTGGEDLETSSSEDLHARGINFLLAINTWRPSIQEYLNDYQPFHPETSVIAVQRERNDSHLEYPTVLQKADHVFVLQSIWLHEVGESLLRTTSLDGSDQWQRSSGSRVVDHDTLDALSRRDARIILYYVKEAEFPHVDEEDELPPVWREVVPPPRKNMVAPAAKGRALENDEYWLWKFVKMTF